MDVTAGPNWYAVRCLFRFGYGPEETEAGYEERITLWRAASFDEAIARAEAEAQSYAAGLDDDPGAITDLVQAYHLFDEPGDGAEIFSLIRMSDLDTNAYINTFFDSGTERQQR
jgi:hypothetical protein